MDGMLSQEEINALLSGMSMGSVESPVLAEPEVELLTAEERDAVGEISNISMGTSATTLFSLVNQKVNISTPVVSIAKWDDLVNSYGRPCVFIQISYKEGLDGKNILILRENDVKIIADLMMGGDGTRVDEELTELHLSAISEAMNQMMGSASTSLSQMLEMKIDISPPAASRIDLNDMVSGEQIADFLKDQFVRVSFRMEIGTLIDSELMQLYPIDFAKNLYKKFIGESSLAASAPAPAQPTPAPAPIPAPVPQPAPMPIPTPQPAPVPQQAMDPMQAMNTYGQMPYYGMAPQPAPMPYMMPVAQDVNVAPVQFQPFQAMQSPLLQTENIDLLLDVPLEVTVELGRTSKSIREILDFAPGTIVELNRLAGEPVDVLVNGKFVAKGEVVVIEEAFGIRVTEVIK